MLIDIWWSLIYGKIIKLHNNFSWSESWLENRNRHLRRFRLVLKGWNRFTPTTSVVNKSRNYCCDCSIGCADNCDLVMPKCHWTTHEIFKLAISIRCQVHEPRVRREWIKDKPNLTWHSFTAHQKDFDCMCNIKNKSLTISTRRRDNEMLYKLIHRKVSLLWGVFNNYFYF